MEKFSKTLRGYNPKEVQAFLDEIIGQVEKMVSEINEKNTHIIDDRKKMADLKHQIDNLNDQINRYKAMELSMNKTIVAAQDSGEQIRRMAKQESDAIISEARDNANRIVNDALLRAEKIEYISMNLRKNVVLFKKRLRSIIETQLEMVDDIETLDLENM